MEAKRIVKRLIHRSDREMAQRFFLDEGGSRVVGV